MKLWALILLCFLGAGLRADLVCEQAIETASPGFGASTKDTLPQLVLGDPPVGLVDKSRADDYVLKWASQARLYVAKLQGSAQKRADVYQLLCIEIRNRSEKWKRMRGTAFDLQRFTLDSGVELFVGELGHFVEIRPDGKMYSGMLTVFENGTHPFEGDWIPPYTAAGEPIESGVLKRFEVDPNFVK